MTTNDWAARAAWVVLTLVGATLVLLGGRAMREDLRLHDPMTVGFTYGEQPRQFVDCLQRGGKLQRTTNLNALQPGDVCTLEVQVPRPQYRER